jgi:hypothetical protein
MQGATSLAGDERSPDDVRKRLGSLEQQLKAVMQEMSKQNPGSAYVLPGSESGEEWKLSAFPATDRDGGGDGVDQATP